MQPAHDLDPARDDRTIEVVIEIPENSQNKYEYDHERGVFRLDRVLHSSVHYPADYGFVPDTLAEDGDPVDVLVLISVPTFPGCHVETRILGCLEMADEKGRDVKILGAAIGDPHNADLHDLPDVQPSILRLIEHFFAVYKELEGKKVTVGGWFPADEAMRIIEEAKIRARV